MKFFLTLLLNTFVLFSFAQSGSINGIITDKLTNEPIPFANITVDGTNIGTTSDLDGKFSITGLKPGYHKINVYFIGYKPKTTEDIFIGSNMPYIEIELEQSAEELEEVVVTVDPFKKDEESIVSMQSIGTKEIESNPGSNRDISRVIQSFPGVGSTPAFRNDVIIRGGGPSENRFFLDGIEIPVLNHFSTQGASGGPVGIINADFIRTVNFYSSAFPADKYNALSGILDFKLKDGSREKTNFQFALGASETALTFDGPIGKKTSYIFSVRRSYLQFLFSAIGLPFLPTYNDYQLKVKTNINKKSSFEIISLGSLDHLALNKGIENPDASQEYILSQIPINNQWSYTIGGIYRNYFDKGSHTFVLSRNRLNNQLYKYPNNDKTQPKSLDYQSNEAENKFRYELTFKNSAIKYSFSGILEYAQYTNKTEQQVYLNNSLSNLSYQTDLRLFKYGFSSQASRRLLQNRLLISLGLRFDANDFNNNSANPLNQTSPRLSASLALTDKTALNASAGRYFQQGAYTTLGFRNNAGQLVNANTAKYIGLNQYNLGIEHKFVKKVLLSVEGFYKDYFQYPIDLITGSSLANQGADYAIAGLSSVTFSGRGKAYGFEILNRWNLKNFKLLASYTLVSSLFTDINGDYIPSSWDSKHLLTVTGTKDLKNNWRVGAKWRYVGGLPYTPYDLGTSAFVDAWDAKGQAYLDYTKLNTLRFRAFHQLDIRVDKNFFFDKWTLMLYLDIQNAYNFKNTGQDYIVREKKPDGSYKTVNNGTEYVLKAVPNQSGTVLPSIGVMIKL
ncbi:MAG TPA: TonB-dependent receptor [Saprospiraceae bacterium]|nr:TonB-dependent receptor [Saprospiraceae bacterium]